MSLSWILVLCCLLPVWSQQNDRQLFRLAEQRLEARDYALSVRSYQQLLNQFPGSPYVPDAQARLGMAFFGLGRPDQAITQFSRVESRFRSSAYLSVMPLWLGLSYYDLGQYEGAVNEFTRYLAAFSQVPDDFESWSIQRIQATLLLARSFDRLGGKARGVEVLQTIPLGPQGYPPGVLENFPTIPVELVTWHLQLRDFDAIEAYLSQLSWDGFSQQDRRLFTLALAEAEFNRGDYTVARERYETLLGQSDTIAGLSYQRLFQIAEFEGDGDEQSRIIRLAELDLMGNTDILIPFWLRVGQANFLGGQPQIAELYFLKIWESQSEEKIPFETVLFLSQIEVDRGGIQRAYDLLRGFIERYPDTDRRVFVKAADLALRQGKQQEVIELLTEFADPRFVQSAELAPQIFGQATYLYVTAYYQLGMFDRAMQIITAVLGQSREGGFTAELLEYRGRIELSRGALDAAQASFRQHLVLRPDNHPIGSAYVRTLIQLGNHETAFSEGRRLLSRIGNVQELLDQKNRGYLELVYHTGLAALHLGNMSVAENLLSTFPALPGPDWYRQLYPSVLYYRGWAAYQLQQDELAVRLFQELLEVNSNHPKAQEAAYLSGWASFRQGELNAAAGFFQGASVWDPDGGFAQASEFLLGKTLRAARNTSRSLEILEAIWKGDSANPFRDDAQYERGLLLVELSRYQEASQVFRELHRTLPDSEFASLSLYRSAQSLLMAQEWAQARQGFLDFRDAYPNHPLIDAALFGMGEASVALGEFGAATLYWQRLANDHRQSTYRFEAMRRTGEIFENQGDQNRALNIYSELVARYPNESAAQGLQQKVDQLGLVIAGIDQREASLRIQIDRNQGVATPQGRQAILELGQLLFIDRPAETATPGNLLPQLTELASLGNEHPDQASRAAFLLGEWFVATGNAERAGVFFFLAATTAPQAQAPVYYYRTIEVHLLRNNLVDAQAVFEEMNSKFPTNDLTRRARTLLDTGRTN